MIAGGGYKYFTNSFLSLRFIRASGCALPVEIWIWDHENSADLEKIVRPFDASIKIVPAPARKAGNLPHRSRWQWVLKPQALLWTGFRHVLFLDADNFTCVNPEFLFDSVPYRETGALFWPDVDGQVMAKREIWEVLGIPFREEREFESGQMVIDTARHREPLEFALKMNQESEKYYHLIWGDKDTFRFAWHKYGRPFAMTPYSLQMLPVPGSAGGGGAMCQHDFDGNRVFQHRNLAKWDLLADNPEIPGYLYEGESRRFLSELRGMWNGRLNWTPARRGNLGKAEWAERNRLARDLVRGRWLLDDRRPAAAGCCGPLVKWSSKSISKPWSPAAAAISGPALQRAVPLNRPVHVAGDGFEFPPPGGNPPPGTVITGKDPAAAPDPDYAWSRSLKRREVAFAEDSTLREGASPEAYWWDLEWEDGKWALYLLNEKGRVARMTRTGDQGWRGRWLNESKGRVGLERETTVFPFLNERRGSTSVLPGPRRRGKPIHVANHAYGIGDAVTGLYAAGAIADEGRAVVYHTRFARWLRRASHPRLTVTEEPPPKGARDMDADYAEQLRYAPDKVAWYAGQTRKRGASAKFNRSPLRSLAINREVGISRLGFPKYVILAPFAAWEARDWPETHWRRLAWLLREQGYEIVAIGTKKEAERLERTFNQSYAYWAVDHDPEWVMDAMLDARAVIGLDSGMIHLAGLLRVPAVCVHAHLPPEFLFSHAPTVRSVNPATGCVFCRWQEDRGFMEGCAAACSAMAVVGPEAVMEVLRTFHPDEKLV